MATVTIESNFQEDLRLWCIQWLTASRFRMREEPKTEASAALAYFSARHRSIIPRPRKIVWSTKLKVGPFSEQTRHDLDVVAAESARGMNLCRRLSRDFVNLDAKDGLLYDWGVHHLHLGEAVEPGTGLIVRSGPVLFALVRSATIYFIDVKPHGRGAPPPWAAPSILDVIDAEWPETIAEWRVRDGWEFDNEDELGSSPKTTMLFRKIGIQVPSKAASGRWYASPGGGVTLGGGDGLAMQQALKLCREVHQFEKAIREHEDFIAKECDGKAGRELPELRFQLLIGSPLRARELQTGVEFVADPSA